MCKLGFNRQLIPWFFLFFYIFRMPATCRNTAFACIIWSAKIPALEMQEKLHLECGFFCLLIAVLLHISPAHRIWSYKLSIVYNAATEINFSKVWDESKLPNMLLFLGIFSTEAQTPFFDEVEGRGRKHFCTQWKTDWILSSSSSSWTELEP